MRASYVFGWNKKHPATCILPKDYRRNFLSLIKEWIAGEDRHMKEVLWGKREGPKVQMVKPVTFAAYLPGLEKMESGLKVGGEDFTLSVSTGNFPIGQTGIGGDQLFITLYNSILNTGGNLLHYPGNQELELYLKHANWQPEPVAFTYTPQGVLLRTLSPVLVRKIRPGQKPVWLYPDCPEYGEWLTNSLQAEARTFLGYTDFEVRFTPQQIKPAYVTHYGGVLLGFTGTFYVNAPPEVMALIYTCGLGAKRSEIFGMVEVV